MPNEGEILREDREGSEGKGQQEAAEVAERIGKEIGIMWIRKIVPPAFP